MGGRRRIKTTEGKKNKHYLTERDAKRCFSFFISKVRQSSAAGFLESDEYTLLPNRETARALLQQMINVSV